MLIRAAVPGSFKLKLVSDNQVLPGGKRRDTHYIGGAELLPAPLSASEEEAAERALDGADASAARSLLIEHNLRLVVFVAKKFSGADAAADDLISVGTIGLIKAAGSFCPDRQIRFSTYAFRCVENEILMYLRRLKKTEAEISIDEPVCTDEEGNELLLGDILGTEEDMVYRELEKKLAEGLLLRAVQQLPERERAVLELRFGLEDGCGEGMTQQEAALVLGVSQSYISRLEKKIFHRLKAEMEQCERSSC